MKNSIKIAFLALIISISTSAMDAPLPAKPADKHANATQNFELDLFENLKTNNFEQVKRCLELSQRPINNPFTDPAIPKEVLEKKITPLMLACLNGNTTLIDYLVHTKKANPQIQCADGNSALNYCLLGNHNNDLPIVKTIVEAAQQPYATKQLLKHVDHEGYTPLERSVLKGNLKLTQYLVELKDFDFNPSINGATAISLAHTKNKPEIAAFLVSKGLPAIADNKSNILASVFHNSSANQHLNLELFDLISYTTQSIAPSTGIKGLENGGSLQMIQPRVFEQSFKKEDKKCTTAQLEFAAQKLGGTSEMHQKTSPLYGGTCSYHAMKNALVGLMLLEDYDVLAAQSSERNNSALLAQYVNADIINLTTLKTAHFDCEAFAENLHAKIAVLNNATQAFMQAEAIALTQGAYGNNMVIAREIFDYTYNEQVSKRHSTLPSPSSKISFIDDQTIRALTTNYRIYNQNNSFTLLKDQDLVSQIALFRKSNNYRHAFHFSLNTSELHGYGLSVGKSRMHAIAVIIDKRGSQVNVLVFESNNHAPFAIKQILFDFIALFTDETKKVINATECETQASLAQDPFCITTTSAVKSVSVCDIESLLNNYADLESKCFATKKRDDIAEALLCLSQIKHTRNVLENLEPGTTQEKLKNLFEKYNINSANLRAREIMLHQLLEEIHNKELQERLITFITQKELIKIKDAIEASADPNYINASGCTALSTAVYHGLDIVKVLIENKAHVNGTDKNGKTPLMAACEHGNLEIIKYLIGHGALINIQDNNGNTPLMYLAGYFSTDQTSKLTIAKELIENYDANLTITNKAGQTAAKVHAICGSSEVFKYLIEKQNVSLDLSALVDCILKERVSLNCNYGPLFSPDSLIEYMARTYDLTTKTHQALVMQIAIAAIKSARVPTIKNLIDTKCLLNVNAQDEQGWTLLMHAGSENNPGTLQKLIQELHADITKKNHKGQTAYDISVERLHLNNLDYFIKNHRYSINTHDCYGSNALHYAAAQCNFNTIQSLVEFYKADINTPDSHGRTALMLASGIHNLNLKCSAAECKSAPNNGSDDEDTGMRSFWRQTPRGHLETVRFLVENGCDVRAKDAQGLTALDYANNAGRASVVDYLNQHINNLPQEPRDKLS